MENINERAFNHYLNKFDKRYFVKTGADKIRVIEGRFGKIAPYAPKKQLLGCWCIKLTPRKKKMILRCLSNVFIMVHQDCEHEFGAYFHEDNLDAVAKVIRARRRPMLSDERRRALADHIKKVLFSKKSMNNSTGKI